MVSGSSNEPSPTTRCIDKDHEKYGGCYQCCERCNYQNHRCHFCGSDLTHNSYSSEKNPETGVWELKRHWLSDCRPDLVEHEEDPKVCTWGNTPPGSDEPTCYAYENMGGWTDPETGEQVPRHWTDKHEHFYPDGPMA